MTTRNKKIMMSIGLVSATAILTAACSIDPETDRISAAQAQGTTDITHAIFTERSGDCAHHAADLTASVKDIQNSRMFTGQVTMIASGNGCTLRSNNIPNHDFNAAPARFAHQAQEVSLKVSISRNAQKASAPTALSQRAYSGVMLNGVPIDLPSAGCYRPNERRADSDGNVAIGCQLGQNAWMVDPLDTASRFGADSHNAHTQPNGSYHYHGNPNAMFDSNPTAEGSPVVGFASDGFPNYGSYFKASDGIVRKAKSGYRLKQGNRPSGANNPDGAYSGLYIDDFEYANAGDLDACNGMTVNGQYGYYVTDSYPWIMACLTGTPDSLDLSQFCSVSLIGLLAIKEMNHGNQTQRRI